MSKPLSGRVALVTGATRGLGRGIAIGLGEAGATVYITGRSFAAGEGSEAPDDGNPLGGSLEETCAAVEAAGGTCSAHRVDHHDDAQVRELFERIKVERNGQLDLLVNNAYGGVQALRENHGRRFWEADPGLWDACNDVGLRSHYIASVVAARMMTARRQGLICTISSWGGLAPIFAAAYGAGKAACDRLAADMAAELRPFDVASLSLWPGIVGTEQMGRFVAERLQGEVADPLLSGLASRFNWETPLLTGRVIAALLADPRLMRRTGKVQIVAELASIYGLRDLDGARPVSLRSLRFALPAAFPALQRFAAQIPDLRVPWWLLLLTALSAPRL
ncbi:MAG TPA: SDR family NAD(P)-dependent oxidoreductase [Cyanobium sp.]|nr:SDR family NAD(P)-dependent oxidoreductase [Cyanobium sp.]